MTFGEEETGWGEIIGLIYTSDGWVQ